MWRSTPEKITPDTVGYQRILQYQWKEMPVRVLGRHRLLAYVRDEWACLQTRLLSSEKKKKRIFSFGLHVKWAVTSVIDLKTVEYPLLHFRSRHTVVPPNEDSASSNMHIIINNSVYSCGSVHGGVKRKSCRWGDLPGSHSRTFKQQLFIARKRVIANNNARTSISLNEYWCNNNMKKKMTQNNLHAGLYKWKKKHA